VGERVLAIGLQEAHAHALTSVQRVTLEVGTLSCIEPETLKFAVEHSLEQSLASHATIQVVARKGKVKCHHCNTVFAAEDAYQTCTHCNQYGFTILDGKDMLITGIQGA